MKIDYFTPHFYDILKSWWQEHNHAIIPIESLGLGLIVLDDNNYPLCMSFIYTMERCNVAQFAWTTTNPNVSFKVRHQAVELILLASLQVAKNEGKNLIFDFISSKGLKKILKNLNFIELKDHTLLTGRV